MAVSTSESKQQENAHRTRVERPTAQKPTVRAVRRHANRDMFTNRFRRNSNVPISVAQSSPCPSRSLGQHYTPAVCCRFETGRFTRFGSRVLRGVSNARFLPPLLTLSLPPLGPTRDCPRNNRVFRGNKNNKIAYRVTRHLTRPVREVYAYYFCVCFPRRTR